MDDYEEYRRRHQRAYKARISATNLQVSGNTQQPSHAISCAATIAPTVSACDVTQPPSTGLHAAPVESCGSTDEFQGYTCVPAAGVVDDDEGASLALARKLHAQLNGDIDVDATDAEGVVATDANRPPSVREPDEAFNDRLLGDNGDARLQEAIAKSLIDM